MDALSEVLKVLQFNSAIFFNARFTAPWCFASPEAEAVARQVNAGSERLLFYHFFVDGSCTVKLDGLPPLHLQAGDIILFPHGDAHTMASSGTDGPGPLLDVRGLLREKPDELQLGGGGEPTRFICGYLSCDPILCRPVLATLQTLLAIMPLPRLIRALGLGSLDELLTAPLTMIARLDDRDFLAQLEAVDDLRAIIGEQARYVGSYFRAMVDPADLAVGRVPVGHRVIDLADLQRPTLLVAGENDRVVPPRAVRTGARRLTGAPTRLTTAPGGHLGVLAGRAAKHTTWARLCAFLDHHDAPAVVEGGSPGSRRVLRPARSAPRRAVEPIRPSVTELPPPVDEAGDEDRDDAPAAKPAAARPTRKSSRLPAPKRASRSPRRR